MYFTGIINIRKQNLVILMLNIKNKFISCNNIKNTKNLDFKSTIFIRHIINSHLFVIQ